MIGVTVLCRPANNEEVIQTAFKVIISQISQSESVIVQRL